MCSVRKIKIKHDRGRLECVFILTPRTVYLLNDEFTEKIVEKLMPSAQQNEKHNTDYFSDPVADLKT